MENEKKETQTKRSKKKRKEKRKTKRKTLKQEARKTKNKNKYESKKQMEHAWYLPELPALPQLDFHRFFFFLKKENVQKMKVPEISAK